MKAAAATPDGGRADDAQWEHVTLPDDWNWRHSQGTNKVWYRIDWQQSCPADGREPVALLLRSVVMAGEVYVNDHHLWSDEQLTEPLSRSWNMPRYWLLHNSWLYEGVNTLWVRVVGIEGQTLGLGPVAVGEPRQVYEQYENLWWRNRTLYVANIIVSGVIGILFFCIWIVRRDQTAYGWYAFSSLFWVVFISNILVTKPWPFPDTLTAAKINAIALLLCVACFCLFTLRFGERRLKRYECILWGTTACLIVALIIAPVYVIVYIQILSFLLATLAFLANCLQFPLYALHTRQREHLMLALCLLVLFVTSLHDFFLISKLIPGEFSILPYANIAITLCLSGILGLRHAHNVRRIEQFNVELADNVAKARAELATTLEREYALALSNTRLRDRLDIAHDLHDGIGGSLVHMMASVEQGNGPVNRPQVVSMLKLIRDDLRQTIDSNSSPSIKVPATPLEWIAPLRHRFTALFDELGIKSEWVFPDQWLNPPNTLQCYALTRIVEEALTNVIKHSRAKIVTLSLVQSSRDTLILHVKDNGIGFDVEAVHRANISIGMRSMSTRMARVGGRVEFASKPGQTLLSAVLTIEP
ncbi:sensor histidine kinase [Brucella grignonensis]|uniref:sensor histidine kinase n=1 Tax=Brucella grignonensis TaxID=94627 RepID=UPI001F3E5C44|nr:7TM diverse intracellular signaling domain-containing protein [Brucella grignonensis]